MRIVRIMIICVACVFICAAKEYARHDIKLNEKSNIANDSWEIILQACLSKNLKSCEMLIKDGLLNVEKCNAKKQCTLIGEIYLNANLLSDSKDFFEKSCLAKDMQGCYYVALQHEKKKEFNEAKRLFELACSKKNLPSCVKMGMFYRDGRAVRQDYEMAGQFYKKACRYNEAQACYQMGILHENGEGVSHDLSLAKEFYGISCDIGLQEGCDKYKELNQQGIPSLYQKKQLFRNLN